MEWVRRFVWDDENLDHIARHGVDADEVEEAITGQPLVFRGPDNRYLAYGRTDGGRLLFMVYVRRGRGAIRVLTARDMTEREKRLYRKRRGGRE